jgi:hypothetical protein
VIGTDRYAQIGISRRDGRTLTAEGDDFAFSRPEWLAWLSAHADGDPPDVQLARVVDLVADLEHVGELMSALSGAKASLVP